MRDNISNWCCHHEPLQESRKIGLCFNITRSHSRAPHDSHIVASFVNSLAAGPALDHYGVSRVHTLSRQSHHVAGSDSRTIVVKCGDTDCVEVLFDHMEPDVSLLTS